MWRNQPVNQALVPMLLPVGDLEDVAAASSLNLSAPEWSGVRQTCERLGAASAIMPVITLRQTTGKVLSDVRLIEIGPGGTTESRFSTDGADQDDAMLQSIAVVANAVVEAWKQQTVADDTMTSTLVADVNFDGLNQWITMRQALQSVPFIHAVRIIGLSAGAARVELDYVGSETQLGTGLHQSDLTLSGADDAGWTIESSASVPPMVADQPLLPQEPVDKEAASGH